MDECKLTFEQIQSLISGQRVQVSFTTLEEYGNTYRHDIELVPPKGDMSNENTRPRS